MKKKIMMLLVLVAVGNKLFYYTRPKDETHSYVITILSLLK